MKRNTAIRPQFLLVSFYTRAGTASKVARGQFGQFKARF